MLLSKMFYRCCRFFYTMASYGNGDAVGFRTNKNKKESNKSSNMFFSNQKLFVILGSLVILLAILNIYTASHCLHFSSGKATNHNDHSASHLNQLAIQHRLQSLEEQNLENALLLESFVKKLDQMFHILGPNTISVLHEKAHSTAATLAFEDIMDEVVPPLPNHLASILEMSEPEVNNVMQQTYKKAYNNAVEMRHVLQERNSQVNNNNIKENINIEYSKMEEKEEEEMSFDDELSKESERILRRMHEIEDNYWKSKEERKQQKKEKESSGSEQDDDDLESLEEEIEVEKEEISLCERFVQKYNINLEEDLGSMPTQHVHQWRTHDCDYILMKRNGLNGEI